MSLHVPCVGCQLPILFKLALDINLLSLSEVAVRLPIFS